MKRLVLMVLCAVGILLANNGGNWSSRPTSWAGTVDDGERLRADINRLYPDLEQGSTASMKQHALVHLAHVVLDFLEANRIDYWLDYGTVLGWIREDRLIQGDRDVDFSILARDWPKIEANRDWLHARGCKWVDTSYRHKGRKKGVVHCDWFDTRKLQGADIYGYAETATHILPPTHEGCRKGKSNMSLPCATCPVDKTWIFPVDCTQQFHLRSVCIPAKPLTHVRRLYGSIKTKAKCDKSRCCKDTKDSKEVLVNAHKVKG